MAENIQTPKYQISKEEVAALKTVNNVLIKLQKAYDEKDILMSETDGELIKVEEIARVRGILSFLENNDTFLVNP